MNDREPDWRSTLAGELAGSLLPVGGNAAEGFVTRLTQAAIDERRRSASVAIRAAERATGMSREDIGLTLEQNPQLIPLAQRVLFQAGMTNQDEVLEALGAMLGALCLSPDDTDEIELLIAGIGDLRRVHLQALRVLEGPARCWVRRGDTKSFEDTYNAALSGQTTSASSPDPDEMVLTESAAWNTGAVASCAGLSLPMAELAVAGLQRSGFVSAVDVIGGPGFVISSSGRTVLDVLRRYQAEAPVRPPR